MTIFSQIGTGASQKLEFYSGSSTLNVQSVVVEGNLLSINAAKELDVNAHPSGPDVYSFHDYRQFLHDWMDGHSYFLVRRRSLQFT